MPTIARTNVRDRVKNLVSMEELLEHVPSLSKRTVQYWMARNPDGFREKCMIVVLRTTFFDLQGFWDWMNQYRGAKGK